MGCGVHRRRDPGIAQILRYPRHRLRLHGEIPVEIVPLQIHHRVVPATHGRERQREAGLVVSRTRTVFGPGELCCGDHPGRRHPGFVRGAGTHPQDATERIVRGGRPYRHRQFARHRIRQVSQQARIGCHAHRRAVRKNADEARDAVRVQSHREQSVSRRLAGKRSHWRKRHRIVARERLHGLGEHGAIPIAPRQRAVVSALGENTRGVSQPKRQFRRAHLLPHAQRIVKGLLAHRHLHRIGVGHPLRHDRSRQKDLRRTGLCIVFVIPGRGREREPSAKIVHCGRDVSVRRDRGGQQKVPSPCVRHGRAVLDKRSAERAKHRPRLGHVELEHRSRGKVRSHRHLHEGGVRPRLRRDARYLESRCGEPGRKLASHAAGKRSRIAAADREICLEANALDELHRRSRRNRSAERVKAGDIRLGRSLPGNGKIPRAGRRNPLQLRGVRRGIGGIGALHRPPKAGGLPDPQPRDDIGYVVRNRRCVDRRFKFKRLAAGLVRNRGLGHAQFQTIPYLLLVPAGGRRPRKRPSVRRQHRAGKGSGGRHRRKRHPFERKAVVHVGERCIRFAIRAVHLEKYRLPPGRHGQHHRSGMIRAGLDGA